MTASTESDTRERLLDAAEKLFSENGIGATSLRAITAEAKANLASIHYHFGSKQALLLEVFSRRIAPVNAQRLELLDSAEGEGPIDLDTIVKAFVSPPLHLLHRPDLGGRHFLQIMGRLHSEPAEIKIKILPMFEEVARRFTEAIGSCLPQLDQTELFWRFHYMVGCMVFTMVSWDILANRSGDGCGHDDVEENVERLVRFISGGLAAPGHPGGHDVNREDGQ